MAKKSAASTLVPLLLAALACLVAIATVAGYLFAFIFGLGLFWTAGMVAGLALLLCLMVGIARRIPG